MYSSFLDRIASINQKLFFFINNGISNNFFDTLMPIVRNPYTWVPLYIITIVFLFIKFKFKANIILIGVAILLFITDYCSASLIKPYFAISRPCNNILIKEHLRLLVHCGSGYSFISIHAANHFGMAAFFSKCISFKKNIIVYILFFWAFLISFAQVYVGVHYPVDIAVGAMYGLFVGLFIGYLIKKNLNSKLVEKQ